MSISFSMTTQPEGEVATRASYTPLGQDFVVFGFKNVGGATQTVFDGYNVRYKEEGMAGITPYSYVGETSIKNAKQEPKYWDYSAEDYRFLAFSGKNGSSIPVSVATSSSSTATMTVGDDETTIGDMEQSYIAELNRVTKTDYRNVVTLSFKRLCARIELRFLTTIPLANDEDAINITDITFAPSNGDKIAIKGKISVDYPLTGDPKETITWPEGTLQYMSFNNVELHNTNTSSNSAAIAKPSEATGSDVDVYTVYPFNGSTSFTLQLRQDGEYKTAAVPAVYTNWKPNYKYVYLFKVGEGLEPILYDVKVEPWIQGGHQDLEFKNW